MFKKMKKYRSLNITALFGWIFAVYFYFMLGRSDYGSVFYTVIGYGIMTITACFLFAYWAMETPKADCLIDKSIRENYIYNWIFTIGLCLYGLLLASPIWIVMLGILEGILKH